MFSVMKFSLALKTLRQTQSAVYFALIIFVFTVDMSGILRLTCKNGKIRFLAMEPYRARFYALTRFLPNTTTSATGPNNIALEQQGRLNPPPPVAVSTSVTHS